MQSNPVSQSDDNHATYAWLLLRLRRQAYADELVTGCTAGEQLPWQQQTSQL